MYEPSTPSIMISSDINFLIMGSVGRRWVGSAATYPTVDKAYFRMVTVMCMQNNKCGVPQGSLLGPLSIISFTLFEDDSILFYSHNNTYSLLKLLITSSQKSFYNQSNFPILLFKTLLAKNTVNFLEFS